MYCRKTLSQEYIYTAKSTPITDHIDRPFRECISQEQGRGKITITGIELGIRLTGATRYGLCCWRFILSLGLVISWWKSSKYGISMESARILQMVGMNHWMMSHCSYYSNYPQLSKTAVSHKIFLVQKLLSGIPVLKLPCIPHYAGTV